MKTEVNGWLIDYFEYNPTYSGLLAGTPTENFNDLIIQRKIEIASLRFVIPSSDIKNINVIKDYSRYNEPELKPIICFFYIIKYEPKQIMAYVLTFANEDESPEDVVERITKNNELKIIEWDF